MSEDETIRVRIDPETHRLAKAEAARLGIPLRRFVTDALLAAVACDPPVGMQPGVPARREAECRR